ncbi:hypothetical protein BCV70DRAFT_68482 [Testicularia cyperi]|uniref:Uncharacterized protein n=1 Tax=Testicularia cyperi TaxID=1882483 RepID=A0A317XG55_9BASI|nr:hypothetical protein BCV70DRAFT_68482 [Testicularia cyperi]
MAETKEELLAQISTIESQERSLVFESFSNDLAFELGSLVRSAFLSTFDPTTDGIVVSISLFSGHTLFACAAGNPRKLGPDNWDWVRRKTNTVRRYGLSSYLVGRTRLSKGKDLDGLGPDYAAHGGAFPINVKHCSTGPIGALVVSGLSQDKDHQLCVNAIQSLIAKSSSA